MNFPNSVTIFRIILVPILVTVLLMEFEGKEFTAFAIFMLAAVTDMIDGVWARRRNQVTTLGTLLDPLADKLLISSVFICLLDLRIVPAWMVIVIIAREFIVTGFRVIASSKRINISSSNLGKIKMHFEIYAIGLLILGEKILGQFFVVAWIFLWAAILVAIVSAGEYYLKYWRAVFLNQN